MTVSDMTRGIVTATFATVVILGLGGCSVPDKAKESPVVIGSGMQSTHAATLPSSTPAGDRGSAGESPVERTVNEARFALPSGNIACALDATAARCDIAQKAWTPPPKPAACEFDYGFGVVVSGAGSGQLTCTSDTVLGAAEILPYGHALRAGRLSCTSLEAGVRCSNHDTGHGFALSREAYELF
jgi:hypothetical protein